MMTERVTVLHDADNERAVLGAMLIDPSVCDDVALLIRDDDFCDPDLAAVFSALIAIRETGKRPDSKLLIAELKRRGEWGPESVTALMLAECANACPVAGNAPWYASRIRDWSIRRKLSEIGDEMVQRAGDETADAQELLEDAEIKVFAIGDAASHDETKPVGDLLADAFARMERTGEINAVPTGYRDLDEITGGMHKGELVILASRPSVGKTSLSLNIAESVSISGIATLIVSLEMSRDELTGRLLSSASRVSLHRIRTGTLTAEDHETLIRGAAEVSSMRLFLDDAPTRTASQIASLARRAKRRHDIGLVIVDYLQLVSPEDRKAQRHEQVAAASRRLKAVARELNVPVLCLSQLNRQVEQLADQRPKLSHLRESGAIEQDADMVWFLHRRPQPDNQPMSNEVECIVAKNRNGPIGTAPLVWFREYTRFETGVRPHGDAAPKPYTELDNW